MLCICMGNQQLHSIRPCFGGNNWFVLCVAMPESPTVFCVVGIISDSSVY